MDGLSPTRDEQWLERDRERREAFVDAEIAEIVKAHEEWERVRNEFARLCRFHNFSAAGLADADIAVKELACELQAKSRKDGL